MTKAELFLKVANPDNEGKTRLWLYQELEELYPGIDFKTNNGGDWCRSDGKLKAFIVHREKVKGKAVGIRLDGYRDSIIEKRIRPDIIKSIKKQRCRVVDIGGQNIECDHKDGRYTPEIYSNIQNQNENDFQPLSRNVNLSKRTHCKICEETGIRYDARRLGYSVGQIFGTSEYQGTCVGCYWHDPRFFNEIISKNYSNLLTMEF